MTTIVKFNCGCIGTEPVNAQSSILVSCESGEVGAADRYMGDHTYEPVDYRVQVWADATDAYAYRELRNNLRRVLAE